MDQNEKALIRHMHKCARHGELNRKSPKSPKTVREAASTTAVATLNRTFMNVAMF